MTAVMEGSTAAEETDAAPLEGAAPTPPDAASGSAFDTPRRRIRKYVVLQWVLAIVVLSFPWLPFISYSLLGRANLAAQYAVIAISLVVLTGWVGQVSLGQGAFVGVGAYVTGLAHGSWGLDFPFSLLPGLAAGALTAVVLGVVALRVRGLYLAVATLIFAWTADAFLFQQEWLTKHSSITVDPIGEPGAIPYLDFTSRRTYYYAAWAIVALAIFMMANLRDRKFGRAFFAIRGSEMAAASLGIDVVRTKLLAFAISGAIAGAAGTLALIDSQVVVPEQFNLKASLFYLAIAVVGGLASLPGAVASGVLFAGLEEVFFRFPAVGAYLELVSAVLLAVVLLGYPGGLAALGRALATRFAVLQPVVGEFLETQRERWSRRHGDAAVPAEGVVAPAEPVETPAPDEEPAGGSPVESDEPLQAVEQPRRELPAWLHPLLQRLRQPVDRYRATAAARRQVRGAAAQLDFAAALSPVLADDAIDDVVANNGEASDGAAGQDAALSWEDLEFDTPFEPGAERSRRKPLIEVDHVTVRFGGLTAVNDFSMSVREGEIVGLIGPNGAGKTTSFNSIAGFNTPTEGRVTIHGVDVTTFPVHLRSQLGVARTFQAIQLFPQLDVFDNLLVATYLADRSGLASNFFAGNGSLYEEVRARTRVQEVIELLELEDVADRMVADLPFGVLRMVEIARALVTGAPLMMLDEPASGLDDRETERLSKLIRFIRSLGVTILLIEHDVKMVTSLSDYMYVIDRGTLIAEGTPEQIQRDPAVIAAYLGESPDDTPDATDDEAVAAARR